MQCRYKRTIGSDSDADDDDDGTVLRQSPLGPLSSPDSLCAAPFATSDELPVFRCQSLSPSSRSISPIDRHQPQHIADDDIAAEDADDPLLFNFSMSPCGSIHGDHAMSADGEEDGAYGGDGSFRSLSPDRISLEELHARLSGGSGDQSLCHTPAGKRLKLETIVEGVFLETPPPAQRGAWCVATQSIDRFVEDQRRRQFAAMLDDVDGGADIEMEMMANDADDFNDDDDAVEMATTAPYERQQQEQQQQQNVDRMLSINFQTKMNMC